LEIILGLTAALGWGVADFSARFAARRIGAYRTLMLMQLFGFAAVSVYLEKTGSFSHRFLWGGRNWTFAIMAGLLNIVSSLSLYRSFELGTMSIAAPVSSAYPALTVALAVISGERINTLSGAGLALTFLGMLLAAISFTHQSGRSTSHATGFDETEKVSSAHLSKGAGWAIVAAFGYGVMFWWLGFHVVPLVGSAISVWVIRLTSFLVLALVGIPTGKAFPLPRGRIWLLLAVIALTDTTAFVCNNAGLGIGHVAVVSMIGSLYGAVTVLLSWIFLRERIDRSQWFGIFLIFAGVVLVSF
jgi:drug/metabolite transporter (DMT)-like permease